MNKWCVVVFNEVFIGLCDGRVGFLNDCFFLCELFLVIKLYGIKFRFENCLMICIVFLLCCLVMFLLIVWIMGN